MIFKQQTLLMINNDLKINKYLINKIGKKHKTIYIDSFSLKENLIKTINPDTVIIDVLDIEKLKKIIIFLEKLNIHRIISFNYRCYEYKNVYINYKVNHMYHVDDTINRLDFNTDDCTLNDKSLVIEIFEKIHTAKIGKLPIVRLKHINPYINIIDKDYLVSHIIKNLNSEETITLNIHQKTTIPNLIKIASDIIEYDGIVVYNDNDYYMKEKIEITEYDILKFRKYYNELLINNKYFNVVEFVN